MKHQRNIFYVNHDYRTNLKRRLQCLCLVKKVFISVCIKIKSYPREKKGYTNKNRSPNGGKCKIINFISSDIRFFDFYLFVFLIIIIFTFNDSY